MVGSGFPLPVNAARDTSSSRLAALAADIAVDAARHAASAGRAALIVTARGVDGRFRGSAIALAPPIPAGGSSPLLSIPTATGRNRASR